MKHRRAIFDLLLISALGLFIELVFIRWVASELRILAFYKNFALIAAFLGLGLGFAYRRRSPDQPLFERAYFPLLAASVMLILLLGRTPLSEMILLNRVNADTYIWAGTVDIQNPLVNAILDLAFYAFLFLLYLLITVLFIPLGELTARKFAAFQPLPGYTLNIIGSLTGILLYTLVSYLGWPPVIWYLIGAAAGLYFLWGATDRRRLAIQAGFACLPVFLTLLWPTGADRTLWSPYYRIDLSAEYASNDPNLQLGYELAVNQAWHQRLWNLSEDFVAQNYDAAPQHFDTMQAQYDAPYKAAQALGDVLIVGAGTGNDVAGALRAGAERVTAVEIDPTILRIGLELHPERPYADPLHVKQVVQDARSFFRVAPGNYDLIVFGLLDSHTLLSTASNIRLDNFVYTRESLLDVRHLLTEDGLLAISYGVPPGNQWVGERLFRMLTDVFGHPPQVYEFLNHDILFLIAGEPLLAPLLDDPRLQPRLDYPYRQDLKPVTDNWPYLYLQSPSLPTTYLIGLGGALLISLFLVWRVIPDFRQFDSHFFFMGAAFFLLETKSVTEMALLFGSTWIVNAVVIAAILAMIVAANLIVLRWKLTNPNPCYYALFAALLFNFFVPVSSYLSLPLALRISLASLAQVIPLFFAGMIFAITFNQTRSILNALGSNLIGAVMGGILEYGSLIFGIRSLYLLALLLYIVSRLALRSAGFPRLKLAVPMP